MTVTEYLDRKKFEYRETRNEAIMNCPFCGDTEKKFAISLEDGAFNCLHLSKCGKKGSFVDFQRLLGDEPMKQKYENPTETTYTIPKIKVKSLSEPVLKYLQARGFTEKTIKRFQVGESNGKVMLPFIKNKIVVNAKYRNITDKHDMKMETGAEPCLFNHDNAKEELIITEGEFDAMALYEYGYNACSVPLGAGNHQWIDVEYEWLDKFKTIYFCFDNDKAGKEGLQKALVRLEEWDCKIVTLPYKDANECLINKISKEEIDQCFLNAKTITPATLAVPSDYLVDILDMFKNPDKFDGDRTFLPTLTHLLKGWREGEVTIWTGSNGAGKSTILNQNVLDLASRGLRICVASLEMPPKRYLKWAVQQYIKNDKPTDDQIIESIVWMTGKIFICNRADTIEPKTLLDLFKHTARKYGVNHFIIDSLSRIRLDNTNFYESQQDFISQLLNFSKKYSCHVHLVAHPRKGEKDSDEPGKVDIKGSGYIQDMADNIIRMTRVGDKEKEKVDFDARITVLKNREYGFLGGIDLEFDPVSKNFREVRK
jgi:twinkle protein